MKSEKYEQKASCKMLCRPNRSKIRHFTEKDVERIAKYAIRDGADVWKLLVGIIVITGFGFLICKVARAMSFLNVLHEAFEAIAAALASSVILNFIIKTVGGQLIKLLPIVRLITLVYALQELMFSFFGKEKGSDDVIDFIETSNMVNRLCEAVGEKARL